MRQPGGGRKKAELTNPELLENLDSLIAPETRGDPESPLRWTTKSTRHLARELTAMGTAISHSAVAAILRSGGYSLQGTRKTLEGAQHSDRDAQFRYLNTLVGFQNSAMVSDQGFQAAVSYSLMSPPRIGRRRILP